MFSGFCAAIVAAFALANATVGKRAESDRAAGGAESLRKLRRFVATCRSPSADFSNGRLSSPSTRRALRLLALRRDSTDRAIRECL